MSTPAAAGKATVAVDGPSGTGKSSTCRGVAARLGLRYLDTGAQYRAMTWWMLDRGIDVNDPAAVAAQAGTPALASGTDPAAPAITVDGADVSGPIREQRVTSAVSAVAAVPEVRTRLVALQQQIAEGGGIVVEGRDIGTVVLPDASTKIWLTASEEVRAARRSGELAAAAKPVDVAAVQADLARRDAADAGRAVAPAEAAADAIAVDTSELTLDQVIDAIAGLVAERADAVRSTGA